MMFLEMARFRRRVFFLVLFHPLQMPGCSKVPGIHQEIEVKSCQTQQHTPHHSFCRIVYRSRKISKTELTMDVSSKHLTPTLRRSKNLVFEKKLPKPDIFARKRLTPKKPP